MTLTIEELKYGAEVGDLGIEAVRAVCAEALANREAQPVAANAQIAGYFVRQRPEWDKRAPWMPWKEVDAASYDDIVKIIATGEAYCGWFYDSRILYDAPPAPAYPERLPCPVHLLPGLKFGKGVPTRSMLDALVRRAEYESEREAMTPEQKAEDDARIEAFKAMLPKPPAPAVPDGWIACSERMPTPFVDVIASDGKQTFTAHFIDESDWWCLVSQLAEEPGDVTHWMPLPAAPEGGNG